MGEIRKICSRGSLALGMPTSEDLAASRALMERHMLVRAVDEKLVLPTSGSEVWTL